MVSQNVHHFVVVSCFLNYSEIASFIVCSLVALLIFLYENKYCILPVGPNFSSWNPFEEDVCIYIQ